MLLGSLLGPAGYTYCFPFLFYSLILSLLNFHFCASFQFSVLVTASVVCFHYLDGFSTRGKLCGIKIYGEVITCNLFYCFIPVVLYQLSSVNFSFWCLNLRFSNGSSFCNMFLLLRWFLHLGKPVLNDDLWEQFSVVYFYRPVLVFILWTFIFYSLNLRFPYLSLLFSDSYDSSASNGT